MILNAHPWVVEVQATLESKGDAHDALAMSAYMKNHFPFLGIKKARLRALTQPLFSKESYPALEEAPLCISQLFDLEHREYHMVALELFKKIEKRLAPEHLPWIKTLLQTKSWWDTVDFLATHGVGILRQKYPDQTTPVVESWIYDDAMWINRTAIICQVLYRKQTDVLLLEEAILQHQSSKEFFLRKAIGWSLRAYAQENHKWVLAFVEAHRDNLSGLSIREALKHFK